MNRWRVLTARSLVAFLLMSATQVSVAAQDVKPPVRPPEQTTDSIEVPFGGTVTEITKTSISIRWGDDQKAKTFLLSETLASGKIPMKPRQIVIPNHRIVPHTFMLPEFMYRLTDVQVGDQVVIFYAHLGTKNICDHIRIVKRPGGRVPPLPEEAENRRNYTEILKTRMSPNDYARFAKGVKDKYIPYHEKMNAYWDLEDKGIPYPEKFGENRRWPISPMPRKLTLDGPIISK